jgi:hypothetical protein
MQAGAKKPKAKAKPEMPRNSGSFVLALAFLSVIPDGNLLFEMDFRHPQARILSGSADRPETYPLCDTSPLANLAVTFELPVIR